MFIFLLVLICFLFSLGYLFNKNLLNKQKVKNISTSPIESNLNKDFKLDFFKAKIPVEIVELLWFADWKLKNYDKKPEEKLEIKELGITIKVNTIGVSEEEPSLISIEYPISEGIDNNSLGYFPSYANLSPIQRYQYLKWLTDITQPIDIGYVFIFYYGLERHIFKGNYENAFQLILKLRKYHDYNNSFNLYSKYVLLACCLFHERKDLFQVLKEQNLFSINEDLFLLAKYLFKDTLSVEELFYLYSKLEIQNRRYIKQYPEKFKSALKDVLEQRNSKEFIDLSFIDISKCPKKQVCLCANISLQDLRWREIPVIINDITRKYFLDYFITAHEIVKKQLREERKVKKDDK